VACLLAVSAGVYTLFYTNFDPIVLALFAVGAFILLFYTYPQKYVGIGEISIFIIWGPLMIGGVLCPDRYLELGSDPGQPAHRVERCHDQSREAH
jgi:1,4-dihydroxy-2-naphthoate octaprenyltransferase